MFRELKRIILVIVIVSAIAPFSLKTSGIDVFPGQNSLKNFSSYEELKNFVEVNYRLNSWRGYYTSGGSWFESSFGASIQAQSLIPSHSTTNIQVEGVDEADIVKTDGEYIYIISGKSVIIIKAYPAEEAEIFARIRLNGTIRGMFINGDKLVVFEDEFESYESFRTSIKVYNVSDKRLPILKRNMSLDGCYFNSRMIDDYVYVVINWPAYRYEGEVSLPKIYFDDRVEEISAQQIYYSNVSDYSYIFTTIVAINVVKDTQEPTHRTFLLGATRSMYVSSSNIYITHPNWGDSFIEDEKMIIHRVNVKDGEIECVASGEVSGRVLNQFSMDEYEGYFRIATTTGHVWRSSKESSSRNHVYILDTNLNVVGKLENLAPREKVYSARFMGDRCYLVTFRKIDPLFVIDLKNPMEPRILGKLKIPGYSDYLHPYDEDHVIGIGKETVAAEEGDFSWYQGVKISLFDISDVEKPKEIAKYEIGDRGTDSPVLRDHKALLFDRSKNILVIPALVAEVDKEKYPNGVPPNTHGDYVWQGAYVFYISLVDGFALKGRVTHLGNSADFMKSDYYFSSPYYVKRSLYIDNVLYTISDKKIMMNSLENLKLIKEVEIA